MAQSKVYQFAVTQNSSACSFWTKASIEIVLTGIVYNIMFTWSQE